MTLKRLILVCFLVLNTFLLIGCGSSKAAFEFLDWPDSQVPDIPAMDSLDGKIIDIRNENSTEGYTYTIIALWDEQYKDVNDYMDLLMVDNWEDKTFVSSSDKSLPVYWNSTNINSPTTISHDFTHCSKIEEFACTLDIGSISIGRDYDLVSKYSDSSQYYLEIEVSWINSR